MIRSAATRFTSQSAKRFNAENVVQKYHFISCGGSVNSFRSSSTTSTASSTSAKAPSTFKHTSDSAKEEIERCFRNLGDLSFENTQEAFKSKSNFELWRALLVLKSCSFKPLLHYNARLMSLGRKVLGKRLFEFVMKSTVYGHFVAGENQDEIKPNIQKMRAFGVKAILDYSVEADIESNDEETIDGVTDRREAVISARTYIYEGEPECDRNMEIFKNCIAAVAESATGSGLAAIKVTALGRPQLLLRLSDVIEKTQRFYKMLTKSSWSNLVDSQLSEKQFLERLDEFGIKSNRDELRQWFSECDGNKDGVVDLYEWSRLLDHNIRLGKLFKVINLKTGEIESLIPDLSEKEEIQYKNLITRLNTLTKFADQHDVRMMVDAEQTYFQPAISRLTVEMMRKYNKNKPVLFNTYQCYLKSALNNVKIDLHLAKREDFYFSAKLVRGAYMIQERKRAQLMEYEDPINENFDATSKMYENCLKEIIDNAKQREPGQVSVMCATHNEDTVRYAVRLMRESNISPSQKVVCFGQLFGMCDQVSFSLGQAGYSVYKYVPYGPVEGVLPYLSRRVQENSGLLEKSKRERRLIWQEIKRRYKSFQWFYNPLSAAAAEAASKESKHPHGKSFAGAK